MAAGGVGYAVTPRTKVKRSAARGRYDRDTVHAILDEAFLCHVAYVEDDQPFVIPTAYCRIGDKVYLHGHISNKLLKSMKVRGSWRSKRALHLQGVCKHHMLCTAC